jgi:uncharacterized protein YegP (UPF0339 family)
MDSMERDDELAEFDITAAEFDAMLADSEPVEVTGPPRRVRFELISGGQLGGGPRSYRWRLVAGDGEILAASTTSYRSPEDVRRALSVLTVAMRDAPIVDADDQDQVAHAIAS